MRGQTSSVLERKSFETNITRSPLRISFAGGGTDLPAYYERFGGFVISAAINRYAFCLVHRDRLGRIRVRTADYSISVEVASTGDIPPGEALRLPKAALGWASEKGFLSPRDGVDVVLASEVSPGTGLGSSSAMAVSLASSLAASAGVALSPSQCAEAACDIEINRVGLPIGKQDQYASAHGGLNAITFTDEVVVEPLRVAARVRSELERRLLLFSTGRTRDSASILTQQRVDTTTNAKVITSLHRLKEIAYDMRTALLDGELDAFGKLLHAAWQQKRHLSAKISSRQVDAWYRAARRAGALGGKITGAGGGGYFLLFTREDSVQSVRDAMSRMGLAEQRVMFCPSGVTGFTAQSDKESDITDTYLDFLGRGRTEFTSSRRMSAST